MHFIEYICKTQLYVIVMLGLAILDIVTFILLTGMKLKLFGGHLFSNTVKIMLLISDAEYYIPIKLCRTAGSIHLFKITRKLTPEYIELKRYIMENYGIRLERSQYDSEWE